MNAKHFLAALALALPFVATPAFASLESDIAAASGNGDYYMVKALTESGANLNIPDYEGYTPLIWAAQHGHARICEYLIMHGANLNPLDRGGYTPLMWATQEGYFDVVQVLLAHGANANARGWNGRTAMDLAYYSHDGRIRDLLYRYATGMKPTAAAPRPSGVAMHAPSTPLVPAMSNGGQAMSMTASQPVNTGAPRALQEPDPVTKALTLKKLAETALKANTTVQGYIKQTTSNFSLGALTDPDLGLGKEIVEMYANLARTQSLVGCRTDLDKVMKDWNGRQTSRFTSLITETDLILKSAAL